ncbi:MAG: glycosyltransferase [Alphaproteobacteria bacterium]
MTVLRLLGNLDPAVGGPPVSSVNSCIAAARAGVETVAAFPFDPVAPEADRPSVERLHAAGIATQRFPAPAMARSAALGWGVGLGLTRWFRANRRRFDIVHCHAAWQWMSFLAALSRGPALVLTPHEALTAFDVAQTTRAPMKLAKSILKPILVRGFDRIVMSSSLEARDSLGAGRDAAKAVVVHHPVHDERGAALPSPRAAPLTAGRLRLGFLGRLHAKKNVDVLIRALGTLPAGVTLSVGGDGPAEMRAGLRRLAGECGVGDRIDWLGFVADGDKKGFFAAIDVLVMPSAYECFGMAAAEALVHGVPVIVATRTGIAEIVRQYDCGCVIAPEVAALDRELLMLLDRPERLAGYSTGAVSAALGALSFATHGRALNDCYDALLDDTAAGA